MSENIVKPQMDQATPAITVNNPNGAIISEPIKPDNTPSNPITEPTPEPEKVTGDMNTPTDQYLTSPLFYEVASYFGIEQGDYEAAKNQLSPIVDYVIKAGQSDKIEDVLVKLRELEDKIQPPAWGEKRYTNLYKYIRLASQKFSYEKAMSALEKKGVTNG